MNMLSTLEYAVEALAIREIIVCGHYGCGGVKASQQEMDHGLADHWLEPIRRVARAHQDELKTLESEAREDRLAELNVIDGVAAVAETPILRRAWRRGTDVTVHGMIYGLKDGILRDLNCSVGLADGTTA
jgi:carbonic anhydrase